MGKSKMRLWRDARATRQRFLRDSIRRDVHFIFLTTIQREVGPCELCAMCCAAV
jgi:hypothetical protein